MRSREEQIEDMCKWATDFVHPHHSDARVAELHILEAERRTEQRVREAIARDSERLDWLSEQIICIRAHAPYRPVTIEGTYDPGELRDAIDAAREAQG